VVFKLRKSARLWRHLLGIQEPGRLTCALMCTCPISMMGFLGSLFPPIQQVLGLTPFRFLIQSYASTACEDTVSMWVLFCSAMEFPSMSCEIRPLARCSSTAQPITDLSVRLCLCPIPGCRPVHDIPRSEWLLNFLIALRTALHLNFFHTKAQNPPARISARTARMNENEPCWWW
jgi:hypothetical protein